MNLLRVISSTAILLGQARSLRRPFRSSALLAVPSPRSPRRGLRFSSLASPAPPASPSPPVSLPRPRPHDVEFGVVDLEGLCWYHRGEAPPAAAVAAVRSAISSHGVWHVRRHALPPPLLHRLLAAGREFFDQPAAAKRAFSVGEMDRSRGWEMYPQHWRHHLRVAARLAAHGEPPLSQAHAEASTREGILCERFVCGPPAVCSEREMRAHEPFYDSQWARVFYESNVWPQGELRPAMEAAYPYFEAVAHANLQCVAAAMGAPHTAFDSLVSAAPLRHHSRLQLNNYPSQIQHIPSGQSPIRASQHFDVSLLSVLARQPTVDRAASAAGSSGALEVRLSDGRWVCVPAPAGHLTVFVGSLLALLSGFTLQGVTHRVSNPQGKRRALNSRRMSLGFSMKPDYTARALPPPELRAALPQLQDAAEETDAPTIGQVSRVGWQNWQMQTTGIPRIEAVAKFKPWKNETLRHLRMMVRSDS